MTAQQSQALHNQPGLNIDLSRMREAALHAQVHGTVFKASGSQVRQVLDYLHERTLEIKGLNARIAVLEAQQEVPHGWKLVPIEPTEAQLATVRSQKSHPCAPDRWDSNNRRIYMHMLAAAPLPPRDETEVVAAKPKPQDYWICLLCGSSRPGHHRTLDDGTTPCPNKGRA